MGVYAGLLVLKMPSGSCLIVEVGDPGKEVEMKDQSKCLAQYSFQEPPQSSREKGVSQSRKVQSGKGGKSVSLGQ